MNSTVKFVSIPRSGFVFENYILLFDRRHSFVPPSSQGMTLEYQIILAGHSFAHFENTILFEFQLIGLEMRDIEIAAIVGEI